MHGSQLKTWQ